MWERQPPTWKKSQQSGVCLQASVWKEQVRLYDGRPPDLLRESKFQRQGRVSPLPFEIIAKTFLADSGSTHEEAGSGSVFDMIVYLPGLNSSKGLSSQSRPHVPLGRGLCPLPSTLPKHAAKLALSEVQKQQLDGFSSSC